MSYSWLGQILNHPQDYLGQTVRISGMFSSYYSKETDKTYYSVILTDQTACCSQGLEFVLKEGLSLPEENTMITVTGTLTSYLENDVEYLTLRESSYLPS